MVNTVLLTTTSASDQTWTIPSDVSAGTELQIEAWGSGSGGSGGNTSNRAGGAGGHWAETFYTVTAADIATGSIAYNIQNGGAGSASAASGVGPDGRFGTAPKNIVPNNSMRGGAAGTLPTGWGTTNAGLTMTVVGVGVDAGTGLNYIDIRFNGTNTSQYFNVRQGGTVPISPSTQYTFSSYLQVVGGSQTGIGSIQLQGNFQDTGGNYVATINFATNGSVSTSTLTRYSGTSTLGSTSAQLTWPGEIIIGATAVSGVAIDVTFRIAGTQIEQAASATSVQVTPTPYLLAKGGGATSGTTGGVSPNVGNSFGLSTFQGGNGATRTAGGGGGGAAGPDGNGNNATTATGGSGDAGSGGAANTDNVNGGGGGTASTSGHVGGNPGGGGGANTSTGSGGTGGRGQIRITYTPTVTSGPQTKPWKQRYMLMR